MVFMIYRILYDCHTRFQKKNRARVRLYCLPNRGVVCVGAWLVVTHRFRCARLFSHGDDGGEVYQREAAVRAGGPGGFIQVSPSPAEPSGCLSSGAPSGVSLRGPEA